MAVSQPGLTKTPASRQVFEALSLLRPYDINAQKVRIGTHRDGGYVLADLGPVKEVMSFGVGSDVTFEYELAERGARINLHDHTVDQLPVEHNNFVFNKVGICGEHRSNQVMKTLAEHLQAADCKFGPMILKIDVEGFEWEVFSTIDPSVLDCFEQIALEIHDLDRLGDTDFAMQFVQAMKTINQSFSLFHVHANNCASLSIVENFMVASVLELAFVKTERVKRSASTQIYPSTFDKANHPDFNDYPLLFYPFIPTSTKIDSAEFKERLFA